MAKGRIDSKTARDGLTARHQPYWHRLEAGAHVGYRAVRQGEGTWCAKWRDPETGKRHQKSLGTIVERDGGKKAFTIARKQAQDWFAEIERGVVPHALTVREVCARYVEAIRCNDRRVTRRPLPDTEPKAKRTETDFRRLIDNKLGRIELGKLKESDLQAWRNRMSKMPPRLGRGERVKETPRSPATVNRDLVALRAALNFAVKDNLISSGREWRDALAPNADADRRRDLYLDRAERKRLIDVAAADIKPFLRGLSLLPLRPGALAALTVADFNPKLKTLRIGTDKAGGERWITVPPATADFLAGQAKGKLPTAPLIGTATGGHWTKDAWKKPIKAAVEAARSPKAATAYTLRHGVITDLVTAGVPILTIAQISGTSVAMVERHYGHLLQEQAAAALARLDLDAVA